MEILCVYAGIVFFYTRSLYALFFIALCLYFKPRVKGLLCALCALLAYGWGWSHQLWVADRAMPEGPILSHVRIEGRIVGLPVVSEVKKQFYFLVNRLDGLPVRALVLLSCYQHCVDFSTGEYWQFDAKLKKPANLGNPGHFDYEGWLGSRHISWTGYLKGTGWQHLSHYDTPDYLTALRARMAKVLNTQLKKDSSIGLIQALTLGITSQLTKPQWDLFRRTGTTHLMVISGAHIGLVTGFVLLCVQWIWRCFPRLCLQYPAHQAAGIAAMLMALGYTLISGMGIPALRALTVCVLLLSQSLMGRRFTGWQAWRYGLLLVLLYEPHAVLLPGFYLSFTAVAVLIGGSQRFVLKGFRQIVGLQLACLIGLLPLTLYWFSYAALSGFIVNIIAIPLIGYVILPFALIGTLLIQWINIPALLWPATMLLHVFMGFLQQADRLSWINWNISLSEVRSLLSLMLGLGIGIFFRQKYLLPACALLILSAFVAFHEKPSIGEARIEVLDVGQGLAVAVYTRNHVLLYDTGMQFYQGSDMGQLAVLPYFNAMGVKRLDKIIISHPDLDHRGGLVSIEARLPVGELIVNDPAFYHRGVSCHEYPSWVWDGVVFRFLPIKTEFRSKNNTSCVLQIVTQGGRALLPGDIEKPAEAWLAATYPHQLHSDVLIAAHHGSKSSSSPLFMQYVRPLFTFISAGVDNRYHFPHPDTLAVLKKANTKVFSTMDCGRIVVVLPNQINHPLQPRCDKI